MILKQGKEYKFSIIKGLYPDTPSGLFVLMGPDKNKYLLETSHYSHYGLKIGQDIKCRVDKINCTGQVFLEPENPAYKIGRKYEFRLQGISKAEDFQGNILNKASVGDIHGKEWPVLINKTDNYVIGESSISCKIIRIKKAQLQLESDSFQYMADSLRIGKYYPFEILGEAERNGEEVYEIRDNEGGSHYLKKDEYGHFGFSIGDEIMARVLDRRLDLSYKLEPKNPGYELNKIYEFDVVKLEKVRNALGETSGIIHLRDSLGMISLVKAHDWQLNQKEPPKKVKGKVISFKKGKLHVENMEASGLEAQVKEKDEEDESIYKDRG